MELVKHPLKIDHKAYEEISSAYKIIEKLNQAGHQAVLAGGAVRDLLLNKKPKDFDIATQAEPHDVLKCFKKTQKVGIAFGVVLVRDFGTVTEVATFRKDGDYKDGRRPESVEFTDACNDAQRRDFTVNGMFYDFNEGCVLDYVDGYNDLNNHMIRAIRNPEERFCEDYLRMIRAIRFAVNLGFNIEDQTFQALKNNASKIADIAADRIHVELQKCFKASVPHRAIQLLEDSGLREVLFEKANTQHYHLKEHPYNRGGDFITALCLLNNMQKNAQDLEQKLIDLRCTNDEKREIKKLFNIKGDLLHFSQLPIYDQKRIVRQSRGDRLLYLALNLGADIEELSTLEQKIQSWSKHDLFPPLMPTGKELIEAGLKPNANMGSYMKLLENLLLQGELKDKEAVFKHVQQHLLGSDPQQEIP